MHAQPRVAECPSGANREGVLRQSALPERTPSAAQLVRVAAGPEFNVAYQSAMRSPPTNCALFSVYSKSSIFTLFGSRIHAW
jgi:hypothetical protein